MKNVETIKEFCEASKVHYVVRLTPYELYLLKSSLNSKIAEIEFDMEEFEWEYTTANKELLIELEKLLQDLREIPF